MRRFILFLIVTLFTQKICLAQEDIFGENYQELALLNALKLGNGKLCNSADWIINQSPKLNKINHTVDSTTIVSVFVKNNNKKSLSIWYDSTLVLSIKMKNRKLVVYENISVKRELVINYTKKFEITSIDGIQLNQKCHLDFSKRIITCKKNGDKQSENSISQNHVDYYNALFNKYFLGKI